MIGSWYRKPIPHPAVIVSCHKTGGARPLHAAVPGIASDEAVIVKPTPHRGMKKSLLSTVSKMMLFAAAVVGGNSTEADELAKEYVVKAAISLNLARFTEWPDSVWGADSQNINMCVLGNKTIHQAFSQLEKKAIGNRFLHVIPLNHPYPLEKCNVIYVGDLDQSVIAQLLTGISGQPKLSIGDQEGFLEQGGLVYLKMNDGKINIQINLEAVIRSGIKISSRVLSLTTIINDKNAGHEK